MQTAEREAPVDAGDRDEIVALYREDGHVTVPGVFSPERMDAAVAEVVAWGDEALSAMSEADRGWFLDRGVKGGAVLRKLDNPHKKRPFFTELARDPAIVGLVEALVGQGVSVYFSQIFFKPPKGGGPKPAHQDNFYFGPTDHEGVVTAWIALDDADLENGCLRYGRGTHKGRILPHAAPEGRPFDLQIDEAEVAKMEMRPAPVPKGGVSFHHGGTVHVSADNQSDRWRRACALHYVRSDVSFANPALPYDHSLVLPVS